MLLPSVGPGCGYAFGESGRYRRLSGPVDVETLYTFAAEVVEYP